MPLDPKYYVLTGGGGSLTVDDRDTSADVDALVDDLASASHVAITIHGGLVQRENAFAAAETLLPTYQANGIRPVFLVWQTGMVDALDDLLKRVWSEKLFDSLVKMLLKHVAGKLTDGVIAGGKDARGLPRLPPGIEVKEEEEKRHGNEEPFDRVAPAADLKVVSPAEQKRFEDELSANQDFKDAAEAAARFTGQQAPPSAARAAVTQALSPPAPTLADPSLFEDARAGGAGDGARKWGFFETAKLVKHAASVFVRVVSRFVKGRDHGVYATVVEEVLREFYGTNVGAAVWGAMKARASEAYEGVDGAPRGGWYFVRKLGQMLANVPAGKPRPKVSVVGHSAGGIYACHLLKYAHAALGKELPADFRFEHAVFLAPACDYRLFGSVLDLAPAPFRSLRLFALNDELESGYWEVPYLYPRSLLYLVSGAFESEADGEGAFDLPLVGMQRYFDRPKAYDAPEAVKVRAYLEGKSFWSPALGGVAGTLVDANRHGEFFVGADGQAAKVMDSVCHLLKNG